jgi:ribosomal protein RSM22 (predicted rRNA methylase)
MELPTLLRQAAERELEGVPLAELRRATEILSRRYRAETRDGRMHLSSDLAVKAYLASRLPATYAAIRASMTALSEALPSLRPKSLLDIGAGPGSALWAATDCWPELRRAVLVEASAVVRQTGMRLLEGTPLPEAEWIAADVATAFPDLRSADLVTIAYVLDELAPAAIAPLIERLWVLTDSMLLVVEPGTPAGWTRIIEVRRQLLAQGASVVAPCPHDAPCPLVLPDWCHFSQRVARSRLHRLAKSGDAPWEDEKFIYLAASRMPVPSREARVLAPPRITSGRIALKLCNPDRAVRERQFTRRDGALYKQARRVDWGDAWRVADEESG